MPTDRYENGTFTQKNFIIRIAATARFVNRRGITREPGSTISQTLCRECQR